jgi:hypothetical protein
MSAVVIIDTGYPFFSPKMSPHCHLSGAPLPVSGRFQGEKPVDLGVVRAIFESYN